MPSKTLIPGLLLGLATLFEASAAAAFTRPQQNGLDPSDRIPAYYGLDRFSTLDPGRIYDLNIAIKRGRIIRIADCTASQSREVIATAQRSHAEAIALVQRVCG